MQGLLATRNYGAMPWVGVAMRTNVPLVLLVVAIFMGCSQTIELPVKRDPHPGIQHPVLQSLALNLSARKVKTIEVFILPESFETYNALAPTDLERQYMYRITVRPMGYEAWSKQLVQILQELSAKPSNEMGDIRWGIVFYGENDVRLGAIYFDSFGTHGAINNERVKIDSSLHDWLKRMSYMPLMGANQ